MKSWLVIVLILLVQETVTLNALLVKVFQGEYSIFFITLLFVFATVIDIFIGHWVERYVKKYWNKGKVKVFAKHWSQRFYAFVGKRGIKVYLLLLGYFSFPYVNAFITSWLEIPFWESFWYLFFGNMIFYISLALLVLGITSVIPNPFQAFLVVIAITVVLIMGIRVLKSRKI
jgi:hypothetical protein